MKFRVFICCAVLAGGLTAGLDQAFAACDGTDCPPPAKVKPLNILQFMREQAASTRVGESPHKAHVAHIQRPVQRPAHRVATARPAALPAEASASFAASQDDSPVQVVASDELNAIDRAGTPATISETVGAAPASDPDVHVAVAEEFNDIDRKAAQVAQAQGTQAQTALAQTAPAAQTSVSWLQWVWSALGSTFAALATAVHHLIG